MFRKIRNCLFAGMVLLGTLGAGCQYEESLRAGLDAGVSTALNSFVGISTDLLLGRLFRA